MIVGTPVFVCVCARACVRACVRAWWLQSGVRCSAVCTPACVCDLCTPACVCDLCAFCCFVVIVVMCSCWCLCASTRYRQDITGVDTNRYSQVCTPAPQPRNIPSRPPPPNTHTAVLLQAFQKPSRDAPKILEVNIPIVPPRMNRPQPLFPALVLGSRVSRVGLCSMACGLAGTVLIQGAFESARAPILRPRAGMSALCLTALIRTCTRYAQIRPRTSPQTGVRAHRRRAADPCGRGLHTTMAQSTDTDQGHSTLNPQIPQRCCLGLLVALHASSAPLPPPHTHIHLPSVS
jgi:hypothetical protein